MASPRPLLSPRPPLSARSPFRAVGSPLGGGTPRSPRGGLPLGSPLGPSSPRGLGLGLRLSRTASLNMPGTVTPVELTLEPQLSAGVELRQTDLLRLTSCCFEAAGAGGVAAAEAAGVAPALDPAAVYAAANEVGASAATSLRTTRRCASGRLLTVGVARHVVTRGGRGGPGTQGGQGGRQAQQRLAPPLASSSAAAAEQLGLGSPSSPSSRRSSSSSSSSSPDPGTSAGGPDRDDPAQAELARAELARALVLAEGLGEREDEGEGEEEGEGEGEGEEDEETVALVERYSELLGSRLDVVLGSTAADLDGRFTRQGLLLCGFGV